MDLYVTSADAVAEAAVAEAAHSLLGIGVMPTFHLCRSSNACAETSIAHQPVTDAVLAHVTFPIAVLVMVASRTAGRVNGHFVGR